MRLLDKLKLWVPDEDPATGDKLYLFDKDVLLTLAKPFLGNTYRESNMPYWWPTGEDCAGVAWIKPGGDVRTLIVYQVLDDETLENTIRLGAPTPSGILRPIFKQLGFTRIRATILTANKALLAHLVEREKTLGGRVVVDEADGRRTRITIWFQ